MALSRKVVADIYDIYKSMIPWKHKTKITCDSIFGFIEDADVDSLNKNDLRLVISAEFNDSLPSNYKKIPNVRELRISFVESCDFSYFPELRFLVLDRCENITGFSKLKKLEMLHIKNSPWSNDQSLNEFQEEIYKLPNLKYLWIDTEKDFCLSKTVKNLKGLKELVLDSVPSLCFEDGVPKDIIDMVKRNSTVKPTNNVKFSKNVEDNSWVIRNITNLLLSKLDTYKFYRLINIKGHMEFFINVKLENELNKAAFSAIKLELDRTLQHESSLVKYFTCEQVKPYEVLFSMTKTTSTKMIEIIKGEFSVTKRIVTSFFHQLTSNEFIDKYRGSSERITFSYKFKDPDIKDYSKEQKIELARAVYFLTNEFSQYFGGSNSGYAGTEYLRSFRIIERPDYKTNQTNIVKFESVYNGSHMYKLYNEFLKSINF